MVSVVIAGAGPAGLSLAVAAQRRGVSVLLADPHLHTPWRATYGMWEWQWRAAVRALPPLARVTVRRTHTPAIIAPIRNSVGLVHRRMSGSYVVVDTASLQSVLWQSAPGLLTSPRLLTTDELANPSTLPEGHCNTRVVDARGARPSGTPRTATAPAQSAFGMVFADSALAPYLGDDDGVLMDWRPSPHVDREPADTRNSPSFLYVVRVPGGKTLAEETDLVGRPPLGLPVLQRRLQARLAAAGIHAMAASKQEVVATEQVYFPVVPAPRPQGVQVWGAAADAGHPATGYSVASSLMHADRAARALRDGTPLPAIAPRGTRWAHAAGLGALLHLSGEEMRDMFAGFGSIGTRRQQVFLERGAGAGETVAAMAAIWSKTPPATRVAMVRAVCAAAVAGGSTVRW